MKGLRFLVSVDGGDETRFTVVRFSGEEAVSSLFSLVLQVVSDDADIAAGDYGKGSFTVTVQYVVKRDVVLKSSEEITFKYPM